VCVCTTDRLIFLNLGVKIIPLKATPICNFYFPKINNTNIAVLQTIEMELTVDSLNVGLYHVLW